MHVDNRKLTELRVPVELRPRVGEILDIADQACLACLDDEYAQLCARLVARLSRKRPSPLVRGDVRIWAAGALYTLGRINFLFDPSQQPHASADQLAESLRVVKSTMANKGALIQKTLDLGVYEPEADPPLDARAASARVARRSQPLRRRRAHPSGGDTG